MTVIYRNDFDGTAGTSGSLATPSVGSALVVDLGGSPESALTGTGLLQGGADTWYQIRNGSIGDCTYKLGFTTPEEYTGIIDFFFHCVNTAGGFWNNDGTSIRFNTSTYGSTVALEDRGPGGGIDSVLATTTGLAPDVPATAWIRLDGNRIRLWLNGNEGTPDIDYTGISRTSGASGIRFGGSTGFIDYIEIDNEPTSPGFVPPLIVPNAFLFTQTGQANTFRQSASGDNGFIWYGST